MPRCPSCGVQSSNEGICLHHIPVDADWAQANRIFCDLLHRRIEPPLVPNANVDFPIELVPYPSEA